LGEQVTGKVKYGSFSRVKTAEGRVPPQATTESGGNGSEIYRGHFETANGW
jgi:hypothetical protein